MPHSKNISSKRFSSKITHKFVGRKLVGGFGIYILYEYSVVGGGVDGMGFEGWVLYYMGSALLVIIHIPRTQKWAGGHRCSLRHNVCRPATDAYICLSNW